MRISTPTASNPTQGLAALPYKSFASFFTPDKNANKPTVHMPNPTGRVPLNTVWLFITTGAYKKPTMRLRKTKDSRLQSFYKANLHAVTPAATFSYRNGKGVLVRSGWLVLDFDKLTPAEIAELHDIMLNDPILGPSIVLTFISPRGAGLKVWVKIDLQFEHEQCYDAVVAHLRAKHSDYASKVDLSGRDITRLCFLSHDPDAYLNPNHAVAPPFPMPAKDENDIFDDSYDPNLFANTGEVNLAILERWVSAAEQVRWSRLGARKQDVYFLSHERRKEQEDAG